MADSPWQPVCVLGEGGSSLSAFQKSLTNVRDTSKLSTFRKFQGFGELSPDLWTKTKYIRQVCIWSSEQEKKNDKKTFVTSEDRIRFKSQCL